MLSEKYKNALHGLKNPGTTSRLLDGCKAESQHIYRVVMTECVPVHEIDETRLEQFLEKERQGLVDYSLYTDRDGLQYVNLERDVEIYPCIQRGFTTFPVEGQLYILSSSDSKSMLDQLRQMGRLSLITDTIQSLAEKTDGTKLQTAFPSLEDVNACIEKGLLLPTSLLEKLREWAESGAEEINFDFVEQIDV